MFSVIELVLSLLGALLSSLKVSGAPAEIVAGIESAIQTLMKVHNTPITFGQLESLRANIQWPGKDTPVS